jgi:phage tail sheath protein FI
MPDPSRIPGVYIEETPSGPRPIAGAETAVTAFVGTAPQGPLHEAVRLGSLLDYERVFGGLHADSEMGYAVRQFFANGGRVGWAVRIAASPAGLGAGHWAAGVNALDAVDAFNLLCLPGVADPDVLCAAAAYCERRRALLIADAPPPATRRDDMVDWARAGKLPASGHAAVYYPWILIADPLAGGAPRASAPCGTLAGLYARTDAERGVWQAPAGTEARLRGVTGLSTPLGADAAQTLTALNVNALRELAGVGSVAWGARTLQPGPSQAEYRYVPVRRLALFIEESVEQGVQWAAFERNDDRLWAALRTQVEAFLLDLFRRGAFRGATPRDACWVRCGRDTTPAGDLERGTVNLDIGFAPLRPAEFLLLRVCVQTARADA